MADPELNENEMEDDSPPPDPAFTRDQFLEWRSPRFGTSNPVRWSRWEVRRTDGRRNHLFDYDQIVWARQLPQLRKASAELRRLKEELKLPSSKQPDLDLFERLYKPPVAHEELPGSEDEFRVRRINVEGVVVRYVEDSGSVQITVEGELPQKTLDELTKDLRNKLGTLENSPCELIQL